MAAPIFFFLSVDDFPEIRALIDPDASALDGSSPDNPMPDSLIQRNVYLGYAESWLLGKLPLAAGYAGDDLQRVKNAITFYTASLLAPVLPNYLKENFGDYSYTAVPADLAKLASSLRLRALAELAPLTFSTGIPHLFDLACGDRGV